MALVPNFSGMPLSGYAPLSVVFMDLTEGGLPDSWLWDFGDGTTSTSQNPTHTYTTPGLKTISLTVTDGSTTTTTTPGPVYIGFGWDSSGDPSYSDYVYFQNSKQPVRFEDRSPGVITSRDWTFGFNYHMGSMYAAVASPQGHHLFGHVSGDKPQYMFYHDGSWTLSTDFSLGTGFYAYAQLIFHNGMYVMGNNNQIWTSPDFYTWTERLRIPDEFARFNALTWGNSEYVAVGHSDASAYRGSLTAKSSDGTSWSYSIGNIGDRPFTGHGLVWDSTYYYAAQRGHIMRSPDGITWSSIYDTGVAGHNIIHGDGIYANGRYIFSANWYNSSAPGFVMTSTNGVSWSRYNMDPIGYYRMHFVDGTVIGVASDNTSYKKFLYSYDTENWFFSKTSFSAGSPALEYGPLASPNKVYICTSFEGPISKIFTSPDTVTWTERTSFSSDGFQSCTTVSDDLFIVCNRGHIRTSSNGLSWVDQTNLPNPIMCATWSDDLNRYVVAGYGNYTYSSPDGTTWTQHSLPRSTSSYFGSAAYGNGRFVITGWNGIFISTDGYTWTDTSAPPYENYIVEFLNGKFYLGEFYQAKVSVDGSNWSLLPLFGAVDSFTYGHGKVIASIDTFIYTSPNDATWENVSFNYLVGSLGAITYGNDFVMLGRQNVIHSSNPLDGADWTMSNLNLPRLENNFADLNDISWDGTTYALCGSGYYMGSGDNRLNKTSLNARDWTSAPVFPVTSQEEFPIVTFPEGDFTVNLTVETDTSDTYSLSKALHIFNMNSLFYWDGSAGGYYNENPFDLRNQPMRFVAEDAKGDHTWDFGDGTLGYGAAVIHNYAIPLGDSSYMNRYRVGHTTNYQLNTLYESKDLTTSAPYVAKFNGAVDNTTITFSDISLYNPTSWDWTFGDGNYSTLQNPVHVYADYTTNYTVTLAVNTPVGRDSTTGVVRTGIAGGVTFTKPPGVSDNITPAVHITRGVSQGIYNSVTESGYTHYVSPADTEWSSIFNTAQPDPRTLSYYVWETAVGAYPPDMVGQVIYLHLISDDRYFEVHFTNWQSGGGGGGFSYKRYEV